MSDGPKLYVHKPKKAQMKQFEGVEAKSSKSSTGLPSSSAISSYYSTGSGGSSGGGGGNGGNGGGSNPSPEIPKPKESFARRYKYVWPMLLTVNLAIGAYLFMRTKKKDGTAEEDNVAPTPPSTSTAAPAPTATATPLTENLPVAQPPKVLDPIPQEQQRELFKWMLEEKRKIKATDPEERKRLDEEKAILKQFLRAKSIPSL